MIDPFRWNVDAAARAFRESAPFAHVVVDDFIDEQARADVLAAFDDEPAERLQDEIFDVSASSSPPSSAALAAFHARLGEVDVLAAIGAITGVALASVEVRAYVYEPGQYLLPHADRDAGGRRAIAFVYYVGSLPDDEGRGLEGGELDLYETELRGGEIVRATVHTSIRPVPNRCVLFEVSPTSLHRVREIRSGKRLSLAGWFHR
ncbi:MAG: 2OG-Fe(II) oxygenase [Polyangiaceae bacterium]